MNVLLPSYTPASTFTAQVVVGRDVAQARDEVADGEIEL